MGNSAGREFPLVFFGAFVGGKCVGFIFVSAIPVSGTIHSQRKSSNDKKRDKGIIG